MNENELVIKNEDKTDLVSKTKTIYNAGPGEIFWKNFLAGFSRTLGGIFVYIIFLLIFSWIFFNLLLPKLMPVITGYINIFNPLGGISNTKPGSGNTLPKNIDILKIFGQ